MIKQTDVRLLRCIAKKNSSRRSYSEELHEYSTRFILLWLVFVTFSLPDSLIIEVVSVDCSREVVAVVADTMWALGAKCEASLVASMLPNPVTKFHLG